MENASKALIIAGSVLIALMILGALMLMFSNLSSYQETNTQSTRSAQITEFNNQYETYNRKDIRGSDIYSLLNRVIDYNRRESTAGVGASDNGKEIGYQPMTISFSMGNDLSQLSADGNKRLIKKSSYTISNTSNDFEKDVKETIDTLEKKYGTDSLSNLASNLTAIFIESNNTNEQNNAISKFNSTSKKVKISKWDDIKPGSTIREEIYTYYEYIQFKRLHFDCTSTKYDNKNGRILEMDFKSNGKLN